MEVKHSYKSLPLEHTPMCLNAAIEAYSIHKKYVDNIALCYFEHEFHLKESPELKICDGESSIEVNSAWPFKIQATGMESRVYDRLRDYVGLSVSFEIIKSVNAYLSRLKQLNYHAISAFDMYCMERRPHYKKIHEGHTIIINGYDESSDKYYMLDQGAPQLAISKELLKEGAEHMLRLGLGGGAGIEIIHISPTEPIVPVTEINISADIERFLENYYSSNDNHGKNGMSRLRENYVELIGMNAPFIIPGSWKFAGERHANSKFIKELAMFGHNKVLENKVLFSDIADSYEKLSAQWAFFDKMQLLASKRKDNCYNHKRNLETLDDIIKLESEIMTKLESARRVLV